MLQTHLELYSNYNKHNNSPTYNSLIATRTKAVHWTKPTTLTDSEFDMEIKKAQACNQQINVIVRRK